MKRHRRRVDALLGYRTELAAGVFRLLLCINCTLPTFIFHVQLSERSRERQRARTLASRRPAVRGSRGAARCRCDPLGDQGSHKALYRENLTSRNGPKVGHVLLLHGLLGNLFYSRIRWPCGHQRGYIEFYLLGCVFVVELVASFSATELACFDVSTRRGRKSLQQHGDFRSGSVHRDL